ncbi:MAG: hypothetical protein JRJ03_14365 [Deltaproteobacteria bacterium]|nr:hypothetical protein [Deltaproteobacteria bacterium]
MPFDLATDEFKAYVLSHRDNILSQEYRELEGSLQAKAAVFLSSSAATPSVMTKEGSSGIWPLLRI